MTQPPDSGQPARTTAGSRLMHAAIAAALDTSDRLLGADAVAVLLPEQRRLRPVARRGLSAALTAELATLLAHATGAEGDAAVEAWAAAQSLTAGAVRLEGTGDPPAVLFAAWRPGSGEAARLRDGLAQVGALLQPALVASRRLVERERHADSGPAWLDQLPAALARVLRAAAGAASIAEACERTADVLIETLPGLDAVVAWEVERSGDRLRRVAAVGRDLPMPEPAQFLALDAPTGVAQVVQENRMAIWQGDSAQWPDLLREVAGLGGFAGVAHVPMYSGGRVVGGLSLFSATDRSYHPVEVDFLTTAGGLLGGQLDTRRGNDRLEEERRGLRAVIETLPEGLLLFDQGGRLVLHNQAAVRLLTGEAAATADWLSGLEVRGSMGGLARPAGAALRDLAGREVRGAEVILRRRNGRETALLVNAGVVPAGDGEAGGTVLVFQDIDHLRELDRLKDDFINTVSHELRTPTTTVRGGALTLLRRGDRLDDDTRRVLLQDIADESERLYQLVEDLLSLSRSQQGIRLAPEPLRLHRLISKVVIGLGPRLGGVPLTVDVPADLPLAEADPAAIEQVLRNLIENAVRHSPRAGRIEVTGAPHADGIVVSVLDRGIGLAAGEASRVFEPFYRSPSSVDAGTQGAGLGLTVCKRLVELSGGRIWAERRPRGGAVFRFTLPAAAVDED